MCATTCCLSAGTTPKGSLIWLRRRGDSTTKKEPATRAGRIKRTQGNPRRHFATPYGGGLHGLLAQAYRWNWGVTAQQTRFRMAAPKRTENDTHGISTNPCNALGPQ